tara:strand:- start:643 stop:3264 length:2622 start_codon:yes stop_codon:yes gene_type:complete
VGYKTEIEIGVRGAAQLDKLRRQVNDLNEKVNLIENSFDEGIQSIHRYDQALKTATDTLRKARIATDDEADAIKKYVTALGEANAAQDLQNRKLQQEITLRERAARIRQLPPTRATTQFAEPIGPQQASFLTGISSPVAGRIQSIKAAQAAMLAAEQQVDKTRKAFEAQFTQTQIKNDELVTQRKIALLDKETQRAIQNSKKENDAALKDFDQRLAARGRARQAQAAQGKRFESLALGAGFPLLFGGGAGQVLGGIAGSFVGSGFGGQILGSAIGGAVEEFLGSAAALGNALNVLNPDLDVLVAAIGAVNTEEGERIKLLEELEGKTAALNAAQAELANLIGDDGVASLKEYSSDVNTIASDFVKFFTIMQTNVVELINSSGILKGVVESISRAALVAQAERTQRDDPRIALLLAQRRNAGEAARGPFGRIDAAREAEIRRDIEDQIAKIMVEINAARAVENNLQLQALRTRKQELEIEKQQRKERAESNRLAREAHALRVTDLRVQQSGVQTQLNQLANEQKIAQIRQQTAGVSIQLERALFEAQVSTLQLEESRLQRELEGLQAKETGFARQRELIDAIAKNQVQQAKIQNEIAKLEIKQGIERARIAQQQVQVEVQRIKLQIQMLRLKAEEIQDDARRAAKLREIAASEALSNKLTQAMVSSADKQLKLSVQIAKQKGIIADNILRGKIESIEAERVEKRRAATAAQLAKQTERASRANGSSGGAGGGGGGGIFGRGKRKGRTATTRLRIDPDVSEQVKRSRGASGFDSIFELVKALDEAQEAKNRRLAREEQRRSQLSASSFNYSSMAPLGGLSNNEAVRVNVNTGPVMEFEGKHYVRMDEFKEGLREVARSTSQSSRYPGNRRYSGIY